jgi:hypothetical protein
MTLKPVFPKLAALALLILLSHCRNYYNETVEWADQLKTGTSVDAVKKSQPDFVDIDWNKPDTVGQEERFRIKSIKGNSDVLQMANYLIFVDGKYQGRFAQK